jgi:holo-[acyl-carrier protein] synthase
MIIGIGCDVVDHELTKNLNWTSDLELQKRYFSKKEIQLYDFQKSLNFLAGRFAVKEAVLKCLGLGMQDGFSLTEIQTLRLENGQPKLKLFGAVKKFADNLGINSWHVSISHSLNCSIAYVIAERE